MRKKEVEKKMQAKWHLEACIFDANSQQGPGDTIILQLARRWLVFFENHIIQVHGGFGSAGRNARGAGGRLERVQISEILRSELSDFWFGFDTPAPVCDKGKRVGPSKLLRVPLYIIHPNLPTSPEGLELSTRLEARGGVAECARVHRLRTRR